MRLYCRPSATVTAILPSRSERSWLRARVLTSREERAAASDDPNSKHHPYAARHNYRPRPDLSLEIPTFLLRRTALASYIRSAFQTSVTAAAHIRRHAHRATRDYRRRATRRHSHSLQRYVPRKRRTHTSKSSRNAREAGMELGRLESGGDASIDMR